MRPVLAKTWGRVGLLCNQASIDVTGKPSWEILHKIFSKRLTTLFGPQQGFYGTLQYNMEETRHEVHAEYGIPIYSLYSETREPTEKMLEKLDTLIVDLQHSGCRVYTFKQTLAACLRAAKKFKKKVVVLDRPNPVGCSVMEGRVLDPDMTSFVGEFEIPMRHGMTMAECALFFNQTIGADLDVIPMEGYKAESYWHELDRPWIVLTPGLPTVASVYVYPGTVLLEGTNLSEGRGTTLPFQLIGAPYIPSAKKFIARICDHFGKKMPPGVFLREAHFQPVFNKWQKQECRGLQIHVTEPKKLRSFDLTVALIKAAHDVAPEKFAWSEPPYEYEYKRFPIELLLGSGQARERFFAPRESLKSSFWHEKIMSFRKKIVTHRLY